MTDRDFDRRLQMVEERQEAINHEMRTVRADIAGVRSSLGELGSVLNELLRAHNALCNLLEGKTMVSKPNIITAHQGSRR